METIQKISTLCSMKEFVLKYKDLFNPFGTNEQASVYQYTINYADFLTQPLTLSMFVPVSETGEVLEEPGWYYRYCNGASPFMNMDEIIPCQDYKKAKGKILFEGFEVCNRTTNHKCVFNGDLHLFYESKKTIEDVVGYGLTLTPNALKLIYG